MDKVNEEFESDFVNKYFKDNNIEKDSNAINDEKEDVLKKFLKDKANEDYKDIHYNPREIDRDSNFYKNTKQEDKEELTPEQAKEKGDKIIGDLGKDYKNVTFEPAPLEGISSFYNREPDELYEEGEELPLQQIDGLFENEEENSFTNDKNISIKIIESKELIEYTDNTGKRTISLSSLFEEKGNMYKRLEIGKMCRKIIKDTKGKRRLGIMLKRKINPEIVKALDATGNEDLVQDYIESIYTKKELPFELTHDLSELSMIEKFQMRKYTKSEEKCGAKILGKIFSRNKALPNPEEKVEIIQQEEKEELAQNVQEIIEKGEEDKITDMDQIAKQEIARRRARRQAKENGTKEDKSNGNALFVQKVNGKNKEVAEKFRQESKREMDELLNNLGSEYSDTDKFAMADYINKYGVEAAKERYKKEFASAEVNLSVKEMIDEKHEKELPGNQQIAKQSEEESR